MTKRRSVTPKRLPAKLRAIRNHFGLSQSQMVHRLNFQFHYGRISEFERGVRMPTVLVLLAYSRAASIPLENIIDDALDLHTHN